MISDEVTVSGSLPRLFSMSYIKKDKHKVHPVIPVMGRITVNGTIAQFSVPLHLWEGRTIVPKAKASKPTGSTADKVKNAYWGFGEKYKLLLKLCDEFYKEHKKCIDVDRTIHSLLRYQMLRRDLGRVSRNTK